MNARAQALNHATNSVYELHCIELQLKRVLSTWEVLAKYASRIGALFVVVFEHVICWVEPTTNI